MTELTEYDDLVNGDLNNPVRRMWNFPESSNYYRTVTFYQIDFKVAKTKNKEADVDAARILHQYQKEYKNIINNMRSPSYRNKLRLNEYQNHQVALMLELHDPNTTVMEILNPQFIGMNKPYKIYLGNKLDPNFPWIGPRVPKNEVASLCSGTAIKCEKNQHVASILGYLRPKRRQLFFNARKPFSKNLLIHELAHTAANHVMFRPDDHGRDFQEAQKLIKLFARTKKK